MILVDSFQLKIFYDYVILRVKSVRIRHWMQALFTICYFKVRKEIKPEVLLLLSPRVICYSSVTLRVLTLDHCRSTKKYKYKHLGLRHSLICTEVGMDRLLWFTSAQPRRTFPCHAARNCSQLRALNSSLQNKFQSFHHQRKPSWCEASYNH